MNQKKVTAAVFAAVLFIVLALSVYAISPVIQAEKSAVAVDTQNTAADFRHTVISPAETALPPISDDSVYTETEYFTDTKTDIYCKMLNTIDRLNRVSATVTTNMVGTSESVIVYDVDIDAGLSYQSVTENGVTVSETYSDTQVGMTAVNHTAKSCTGNYLPTYTRNDTPYIPLSERIVDIDGIPCYSYRRNITNCPLASYCLVPQELAFSYLKDFDTWEITDDAAEYLGRKCIVIEGKPSPYIAAKHGIRSFRMTVDQETGVLLNLEGLLNGKRICYITVTEICYQTNHSVKQFDSTAYSAYKKSSR